METPASDTNGQTRTMQRRRRETMPKIVTQVTSSGAVRWMLSGLYVNGQRKREFFTDLDSAKLRLQTLQTARENTGTLADRIAFRPEHAADAGGAADLLTPYRLTLLEVAREYLECRQALDGTGLALVDAARQAAAAHESRRKALTLTALGERFQTDPETLKRSKAYRDDARKRWRRFADHMGPETLATDVTSEAVRRWIMALPVADITRGNFHRNCSAVFSYAMNAELVTENPFRKVKKPTVETKDGVEVFTPGRWRRF